MEDCVLVGESLSVLTRSKGHKVGHSSRHNLVKQLQVDDSIVFIVSANSELNPGSRDDLSVKFFFFTFSL